MNRTSLPRSSKPMQRTGWNSAKSQERSKAEKRFQAAVEELAVYLGWFPVHVLNMRGTAAGLPDLILIRERVVWAELKAYSDTTGKAGVFFGAQERFRDLLLNAGQEWYLWYDDSDGWKEIKAVLSRGGSVVAS